MESAKSDLRGDQGAPRTSSDDTRDPHSSSSPAITQALITDLLLWLDNRNATAQFDAIAEKFYNETGFMRPGKSMPMEMWNSVIEDRRNEAWSKWIEAWRLSLIDKLAALAFAEKG